MLLQEHRSLSYLSHPSIQQRGVFFGHGLCADHGVFFLGHLDSHIRGVGFFRALGKVIHTHEKLQRPDTKFVAVTQREITHQLETIDERAFVAAQIDDHRAAVAVLNRTVMQTDCIAGWPQVAFC